MCKTEKKMSKEELEGLLHMRKRGAPSTKKGKGSYRRSPKHRGKDYNE